MILQQNFWKIIYRMSVSSDENDGVTLNRIKLKYLSKKKDSYGNELFYYVVENESFEEIVGILGKDFKVPWFKGEKNTVLKVKSRWLKGNKKATDGGMGNITMKEDNFEGTRGSYVNGIAFK